MELVQSLVSLEVLVVLLDEGLQFLRVEDYAILALIGV